MNYFLSADRYIGNSNESRYGTLLCNGRRTLVSPHLFVSNQIANIILATIPYDVAESLPIVHFVMYPLRETADTLHCRKQARPWRNIYIYVHNREETLQS